MGGWTGASHKRHGEKAAGPLSGALTWHVGAFQSGQRPSSQGSSPFVSGKTAGKTFQCVCVWVYLFAHHCLFLWAVTVRSKQSLRALRLTPSLSVSSDNGVALAATVASPIRAAACRFVSCLFVRLCCFWVSSLTQVGNEQNKHATWAHSRHEQTVRYSWYRCSNEWTVMNVGCEHFLITSIASLIITPIIRHYNAFIQLGLYRCGILCR